MRTDIYWSSRSSQSPAIVFSKALSPLFQGLKTFTQSVWENAKQGILRIGSGYGEPRIWHTTDRQGNLRWHLYDPVGEKRYGFESELAVRCWLEQRYNLKPSHTDSSDRLR